MIRNNMFTNGLLAECLTKLTKISKEDMEKRLKEINNCEHLFVILKKSGNNININSDIFECVHCGVTNKYSDIEKTALKYHNTIEYYMLHNKNEIEYNNVTLESVMMKQIIKTGKSLNLLSEKVIRTSHPSILYQIALIINKEATNDEIYEIMYELNELETFKEKNSLLSIDDIKDLIDRYHEHHKVLKK